MESLKDLCMSNLCRTLYNLEVDTSNKDDILDLLCYVYEEDDVASIAELREMVLLFVTTKAKTLCKKKRFKRMMDTNALLGSNLVYKLSGLES